MLLKLLITTICNLHAKAQILDVSRSVTKLSLNVGTRAKLSLVIDMLISSCLVLLMSSPKNEQRFQILIVSLQKYKKEPTPRPSLIKP
jgi:hypothetical protein